LNNLFCFKLAALEFTQSHQEPVQCKQGAAVFSRTDRVRRVVFPHVLMSSCPGSEATHYKCGQHGNTFYWCQNSGGTEEKNTWTSCAAQAPAAEVARCSGNSRLTKTNQSKILNNNRMGGSRTCTACKIPKPILCPESRCQVAATKGQDYNGTVKTTASGLACREWSSTRYSSVGSHSYCRNPSSYSGGLWCYTSDPSKRWEVCDVPTCPQGNMAVHQY
jgi:hypothetical protein